MMCRLKPLVLICVAAFLAGCAGGPQTQPPTLNLRRLSNSDSPLALSARLLDRIVDTTERMETANQIAAAHILHESNTDALVLVDYAASLFVFTGRSARAVASGSQTAVLYSRIGRSDDAVALLDAVLQRTLSISDSGERGQALEAMITASFAVGEESFDLLINAVQSIFVIEDLWVRVRLLTFASLLYHEAGNRGTSNSLMQQAIPAAGSLSNPWRRAAAMSEVAVLYHHVGNRDAAIVALDGAMDEIRRTANGPAAPSDEPYALHMVDNVVLLAQQLAGVELIDRIATPGLRTRGLSGVAVSYGLDRARSAAYIFFSRAVREASLVDSAPARVEAMTDVAFGYLQIGDNELAVIQANGAGSVTLQIPDSDQQIAAGQRVMAVYARAGETGRAVSLLDELPEGRIRDEVTLGFALSLIAEGRQADASDLLRRRFPTRRADIPGALAAEIAVAFANSRNVESALNWMEPADYPRQAARALVAAGRERPTLESMSAAERDALARVHAVPAGR